jgi:predicted MFS family arabinose efflux permease
MSPLKAETRSGLASGWGGVAAAFCSCLLGLGLARFAYTPLIPALIGAHWFSPGEAAYLGAANIGGYLAGALLGSALARRLGVRRSLRAFMALTCLTLFACSLNWGFGWYLVWRLLSGFAAAVMMVTAPPSVLPLVEARHRGLASGLIFVGIGLGIAASGSVAPLLLRAGLPAVWLVLGGAGTVLTMLAWNAWPTDAPVAPPVPGGRRRHGTALSLVCAAYAASAFAQVPAILFLADFVARGLHQGTGAGAAMWAILGAGALAGPLAAGFATDRIGAVAGLRLLWLTQILALALLAWPAGAIGQAGASVLLGAGIPGLVVLLLARTQTLAAPSPDARRRAWSFATTAYASGQAVGAYPLSFLFARTEDYRLLFIIGVAGMLAALGLGEASCRARR